MVTRRTTIVGLGGLLAGGGALISTGAFNTIEAERSVSLATAGDASAFLGLEIIDEEYVDMTDGTIEFDIIADGRTVFDNLVDVRNNGTQAVTSLRFEFLVTGAVQDDDEVEEALKIVSGDATIDAVDEENLLVVSDARDADDDRLAPGEAIPFGIEIDLTAVDIDRIDGDPEITLRIIADTGEVDDPEPTPGPINDFTFTESPNASGNEPNISFSIEKAQGEATIAGFRIDINDAPGGNDPDSFDAFAIEADSTISGDNGYEVGEDVSHSPFTISGPDDPIEYSIDGFRQNGSPVNMNSVLNAGDVTVVLLGEGAGQEWPVGQ